MNSKSYVMDKVYPFTLNECLDRSKIQQELLPFLIKSDIFASCWNKIYKLALLKENHIFFPDNIHLGEDYLFNITAFSHISRFFHRSEALYNYRFVEESCTNNYNSELFDYYIKLYLMIDSIVKNWSFVEPEERKELSAQWFINKALYCIYKEISVRRLSGIIKGSHIMNNEFVREKVGEIRIPPYEGNRFMNYLFEALVKRKYMKFIIGTYYTEYLSPKIAKLRG